jgi:hypothetical protein
MNNKFTLAVVVSFLSFSLVSAQEVYKFDSKELLKDCSFGFNYGITQFDGDIRQYDFPSAEQKDNYGKTYFKELRTAFSFSLEKNISENISVSIENISGEFAGLRRPNEYVGYKVDVPYSSTVVSPGNPGYFESGDKFVTTFNETDILLNYNINSSISKLLKKELSQDLSINIKLGLGYNSFRSLRTDLYNDNYIYSFGYDELTKNESNDPVSETVFVAGTKLKYEFEKGISLVLDYTIRVINSDKWDSSIMEGGQGKDRFSFLSFGLAYDLGKVNKVKEIIESKD